MQVKRISSASMCRILLIVLLILLLGLLLARAQVQMYTDPVSATIEDNLEVIAQFHEKIWFTLDDQAKIMALQTIADIEATYLGLPHRLTVVMKELPSDNILATYNDALHQITVNSSCVKSCNGEQLLLGCLHEAFHAYEYGLCTLLENADNSLSNLLLLRDIAVLKNELDNYIDYGTDRLGYYFQDVEVASRAYSEGRIRIYESFIPAM